MNEKYNPLKEIMSDAKPLDLVEISFPAVYADFQTGEPCSGTERITGYFVDADEEKATLSIFQKAGDPRRDSLEEPMFRTSIHSSAIRNKTGAIEVPFTVKLEDRTEDVLYRIKERFVPDKKDAIDQAFVRYGTVEAPEDWYEK